MEGRGAGTEGISKAAALIEHRYRALGLQAAGSKGYFQPFNVITGAKLKDANRLEVANGTTKVEVEPIKDFVPFSFSSSGEASGALA
jgi:hypothetical protein